MVGRTDCRSCKAVCDDLGIPTKCPTCFPGVHRFNQWAYRIYCRCSNQYIMGMGGAVTLNALAVEQIFNYMDIPMDERLDLLMQVQTIASSCISTQHEDAQKKREAARKK